MAKMLILNESVRQVISELAIEGNTIKITKQLERPLYEQVNKILEAMGGKWSRSKKAHLFEEDPTEKVEDVLLTGRLVNLKKAYDFFETPPEIARQMVARAWLKPGMRVLEPSAGRGVIADTVKEFCPSAKIDVCEIQPENQQVLAEMGYPIIAKDFMMCPVLGCYDRVLMNPPFSRQQDIDHVTHAFHFLKPGGCLVAIMASGVKFRRNLKTLAFIRLLEDNRGEIVDLPEESFKKCGTSVNTVIVTIVRK